MKRQLERLKGKRLVTGDPNLMIKNEICINETHNGVEVKEIGTDGKIKDLADGGSNKEYDDLHTYLYYDDRIVSLMGMELPLCSILANMLLQLTQYYHCLNTIFKINNTEEIY